MEMFVSFDSIGCNSVTTSHLSVFIIHIIKKRELLIKLVMEPIHMDDLLISVLSQESIASLMEADELFQFLP